jgi:carboxypeptidase Taq
MESTIKQYENIRKKMLAYQFVNFMISWDSNTEAPEGCFPLRSRQVGILSEETYKLQTAPETVKIIDELYLRRDELDDEVLKHEITESKEGLDKLKKVPIDEYIDYMSLLAESESIWAKAKRGNDYEIFRPTLEKIVDFNRKYIKYVETDKLKGYDILLDEYEKGMTIQEYDQFFEKIKTELVPFVLKIIDSNLEINDEFNKLHYPKSEQKEFLVYIVKVLDFDLNKGVLKESEHPFTSGFGTTDVRITNHYYEDNFTSAIFSGIHELGHALYEQQVSSDLDYTLSGGGGSMALHESQSRFYENIIGRSLEFWKIHFPKLKGIFKKQLRGVKVTDFYKLINKVEATLIRTEADELTYPIHIMIRYDLEKALFNNELEVKDLPKAWNAKYKEYLGLDVPSAKEGVLQDIHWAGGSFGYFPTYALGSAYSAQIYKVMNKDFKVLKSLETGTTKEINLWLKEHLHFYGSSKPPKELFKICVGEKFNPKHYINYLIKKYSKIYNIK